MPARRVALILPVVLLLVVAQPAPSWMSTNQSTVQFGTLGTQPDHAKDEANAGLSLAEVDIAWDRYEPQPGKWDTAYVNSMRTYVQSLRAAGLSVILGPGLEHAPQWVIQSDGGYVNQYGVASTTLNLTFSQTERGYAERYLRQLSADFGPSTFWGVRVGSGGDVEALYPRETDTAGNKNAYWAYDTHAQSGAGLPSSIKPNPFPGWKPGDRTYHGAPFTTDQVRQWYAWYVGSMVDGINWQIATIKAAGLSQRAQVVMPGLGTRPQEYSAAVADYLAGAGDANGTLGRGATWNMVVDNLTDRNNVSIDISSVADGSGDNNVCLPDDTATSLDDPAINTWSATRWLSFNADRYGMAKDGENPGRVDQPSHYGPAMLGTALSQVQACGLRSFTWAHDSDLHGPTPSVSLAEYLQAIAQPR